MRKTVVLSVLLLLVLSSVAFASPEFIAKYAAVKPEIDGILDDAWAEAPVVTLTMENYEAIGGSYASRGPGGFAAGGQFRVMWDDENLYVFIDVADRDHSYNANPGSNFINNNVVQMPIKPGPNAGKFIFDLIATSNVGTPLVWENWVIPGNVDIPIAGIVTFGGYIIEAAFPWSLLQPDAVGEGVEFPFAFFIVDATDTGQRRGFLFPWSGGDASIQVESEWNTLRMVK